MKPVLLLLLSTLLITSCHKGKTEITVRGTLTDDTFGAPLNNASVSIYEVDGSLSEKLIGTAATTDLGRFSFTMPRNQIQEYHVVAEKSGFFTINESIPMDMLTIDDANEFNYSTTAKAYVKLQFVNQTAGAGATLRFIKQTGKSGCDECLPDEEQFLYGIVDTSIVVANDGNSTFAYFYEVLGTSNFGVKTATSVAFDTTTILLNY